MREEGLLGITYNDGDVIVEEGTKSREMYLVQHGQVRVVKEGIDSDRLVATLREGEIFGEMGLLDAKPRSATVKALGEARVLTIDHEKFLELVITDPSFALMILRQMGERIRDLNTMLSITLDQLGALSDKLGNVKESVPAQEALLSKALDELRVVQVELVKLREGLQARTES